MSDSPAGRKSVNATVAYRWPVSHLQRSSSAVRVPIANATPGWGLTAISQGLELREGAADDAALLIPQVRNPPIEFLTARIPEGIRFAAALGEGMTDDAALLIPQVRNPPIEFLTARIPEGIRFAAALGEGMTDDAALLIPQVRNPPIEFLTARIPEGIRFAAALGEGMTDDAALLIPQVRNPPIEFLTARIPEGIRFAAALGEGMTSLVGSVSRPAAATVAAVRHLGVPGSARADPGTAKRAR